MANVNGMLWRLPGFMSTVFVWIDVHQIGPKLLHFAVSGRLADSLYLTDQGYGHSNDIGRYAGKLTCKSRPKYIGNKLGMRIQESIYLAIITCRWCVSIPFATGGSIDV
ncbi:hypothetical protein CEXT_587021 [Caerostris extrusa]|uniref:Uncharacterized protein n=1 Tax=Caerostris extrusa TaxID=172846 RepID=A0AAV4N760_CAEEX|nr:hypothetical protein CEXT_587021 [Caerostris extrusa]